MTARAVREVVLCADDAGWDEASDEVIRRHARDGHVSAVSVLVHAPNAASWAAHGAGMPCALGLHFDLTWSPTHGSRGLGRLLLAAHARRVSPTWVADRVLDQLVRFEALYGRPPDFVDGHQHVHILPGVREPLLDLLVGRYGTGHRPLVRVPYSRSWRGSKAALLNRLGARRLRLELDARGWGANGDFAGAYDMRDARGYRQRMKAWLATIETGGLIMAHPGSEGKAEHAAARAAESAYFASRDWPRDLAEAGVRLVPFTADAMRRRACR